jgi:hypothetical protein
VKCRVAQQGIAGERPRSGEGVGRHGGGRLHRAARRLQARVPDEQPDVHRRWIGPGLVERTLDKAGELSGLAGGWQAFGPPQQRPGSSVGVAGRPGKFSRPIEGLSQASIVFHQAKLPPNCRPGWACQNNVLPDRRATAIVIAAAAGQVHAGPAAVVGPART